jgi:DNA-binding response OmpR family regulator
MSCKLIVADESVIIQKTLEKILSDKDFQITFFSEGESAYKSIMREVPDVVIADTRLSEIDGYKLCEKIKSEPSLRSVRVILLAPVAEGIDERLALETGADDCLIKPFEPDDLHNSLEIILDTENIIRELRIRLLKYEEKIERTRIEVIEKIMSEVIPEIEDSIVKEVKDTVVKIVQDKIPYAVERAVAGKIKEIKNKKNKSQ